MQYERLELLVGGEWIAPSGNRIPVINPATGELLAELPLADAACLDTALEASREGFEAWRRVPAIDRQMVMEGAARLIEARRETIATICTLESGKPIAEARTEVDFALGVLRWYGEEGRRAYGRVVPSRAPDVRGTVVKEPVGPVAAFVAWNFPAVNVMRKVAGALAAGCSIIIKPSEETPGTAIALARCFLDAGLPPKALSVVFGDPAAVSTHLLASPIPRKVSVTGSIAVGTILARQSADTLKRCTLELGGNAPFIVFDDADVTKAAKLGAAFKFRNAGQVCTSPSRFFVHDRVHDAFVREFREAVDAIVVGDGLSPDTTMGPLAAARRVDVMERLVADARRNGAHVASGGERLGNAGSFYAPTVLTDVSDRASIMKEEAFGPVAPISRFEDMDEVLERANSVDVGLASYVFTKALDRSRHMSDRLRCGLVGVNSMAISLPETPFGGTMMTGYGSEGGVEGLDAFLQTKFISEAC